MKDYYKILGIPENASDEDIRKAFRKLAFQYHPDKNIGREKEAEQKFKDINEAYCVLSNDSKRQQYDMVRKGQFAGVGSGNYQPYQGFQYSQEDIFRDTFTNRATMEDLNRMFAQAGLRFDPDFLNRVFFSANNVVFRVYYGAPGRNNTYQGEPPKQSAVAPSGQKPSWLDKMASKATLKISTFIMKKLFGIQLENPQVNLDRFQEVKVSPAEAKSGGEKQITWQSGRKRKKLLVKIPPGILSGSQIRLRGMGAKQGNRTGDLFLVVQVAD
jgi:DnaJ-class molecular chaperone